MAGVVYCPQQKKGSTVDYVCYHYKIQVTARLGLNRNSSLLVGPKPRDELHFGPNATVRDLCDNLWQMICSDENLLFLKGLKAYEIKSDGPSRVPTEQTLTVLSKNPHPIFMSSTTSFLPTLAQFHARPPSPPLSPELSSPPQSKTVLTVTFPPESKSGGEGWEGAEVRSVTRGPSFRGKGFLARSPSSSPSHSPPPSTTSTSTSSSYSRLSFSSLPSSSSSTSVGAFSPSMSPPSSPSSPTRSPSSPVSYSFNITPPSSPIMESKSSSPTNENEGCTCSVITNSLPSLGFSHSSSSSLGFSNSSSSLHSNTPCPHCSKSSPGVEVKLMGSFRISMLPNSSNSFDSTSLGDRPLSARSSSPLKSRVHSKLGKMGLEEGRERKPTEDEQQMATDMDRYFEMEKKLLAILKVRIDDVTIPLESVTVNVEVSSDTISQILSKIERKLKISRRTSFGLYLKGKYLGDESKKIKDVIGSPTAVTYALVPEASLFEHLKCGSSKCLKMIESTPPAQLYSNSFGSNALHFFISSYNKFRKEDSQFQVVKAILKKKKEQPPQYLEQVTEEGQTALMMACHSRFFTASHFLLQSGALAHYPEQSTQPIHQLLDSPLEKIEAEEKNILSLFEKLVERGACVISKLPNGFTPLHLCAKNSLNEVIKLLLTKYEIHPDVRSYQGETPLHAAAAAGNLEGVKLLVTNGAKKTIANVDGVIPYDIALEKGHEDVANYLYDRYGLPSIIWEALRDDKEDVVKDLCSPKGARKLCKQTSMKSFGKLQRLLTVSDILSISLFWAAVRGKIDTVKWLVSQSGTIIDWSTPDGTTPLAALIQTFFGHKDYIPTISLLLSAGASVNTKNLRGESLLHIAALAENRFGIHFLFDEGHFLNTFNWRGETEMHVAVLTGNKRVVTELLRAGSDPEIKASIGRTCVEKAKFLGSTTISSLLVSHIRKGRGVDQQAVQPNLLRITVEKLESTEHLIVKSITSSSHSPKPVPANSFSLSDSNNSNFSSSTSPPTSPSSDVKNDDENDTQLQRLSFMSMSSRSRSVGRSVSPSRVNSSRRSPPGSAISPKSERRGDWVGGEVDNQKEKESEKDKEKEKGEKDENGVEKREQEKIKEWWKEEGEKKDERRQEKSILGPLVFCEISHQLEDKVLISKLEKVKDSEVVVVRKENIFYREVSIRVFSVGHSDDEEHLEEECLAKGEVFLDPRIRTQDITVDLFTPSASKFGVLHLSLEFKQTSEEIAKAHEGKYAPLDPFAEVKKIKKRTHKKKIGEAMFSLGYKAKYPIVIVPGIASCALEAWETNETSWHRERIWVDPFKVGKTAGFQKISNMMAKNKEEHTPKSTSKGFLNQFALGVNEDIDQAKKAQMGRKWIQYMMLDPSDGVSDPPGVKIRPVQGLHGCDFLSDNPICKAPSYVFGYVIRTLTEAGYDTHNLDAAPYDWRLPPEKLFERDNYFRKLKYMILAMRERNEEKVVIMAHSMGNRCVQYFLHWLKLSDPSFLEQNIHSFMALGPPFLGAPKTIRSLIVGDAMGLEMFLTQNEARTMSRNNASLPWLFPLKENLFPDVVARAKDLPSTIASPPLLGETGGLSGAPLSMSSNSALQSSYQSFNMATFIKQYAEKSYFFFEKYYLNNPNYLKKEGNDVSPIFQPPPVENLWVIYGVNLPTEVSYFFKPTKAKTKRLQLDSAADKYSYQKIAFINPRGLKIMDGVAFEMRNTYQPNARTHRSGDGTVPYVSLNFPSTWKDSKNAPKNIKIVEVEGAEHREMLNNEVVFYHILQFVCEKKTSKV